MTIIHLGRIPFLMHRHGVTVMDQAIVVHGIFMMDHHAAKSGVTTTTAGGNTSTPPVISTNRKEKNEKSDVYWALATVPQWP